MAVILGWLVTQVAPDAWVPEALRVPSLLPGWSGSLLAVVCLLQFLAGLVLHRRYEGSGSSASSSGRSGTPPSTG